MNVFISQPMSGLSVDEIKKTRQEATTYIAKYLMSIGNTDIPVIADNLQEDKPVTTHSLEYLGNDIIMLKDVQLICFVKGWEKSRGCNIEFQVAKHWDIPMIFM